MDTAKYKEQLSKAPNRLVVKEHGWLHMNPAGGIIKHMIVVAEMGRRNIRHILRKDKLDEKWQKTMSTVGKGKQ